MYSWRLVFPCQRLKSATLVAASGKATRRNTRRDPFPAHHQLFGLNRNALRSKEALRGSPLGLVNLLSDLPFPPPFLLPNTKPDGTISDEVRGVDPP